MSQRRIHVSDHRRFPDRPDSTEMSEDIGFNRQTKADMSTFPSRYVPMADEHRHKRPRTVRRSTHSCSECKFIYSILVLEDLCLTSVLGRRRKVRCQLSTDKNIIVCSGCIQRDTPCVVQEYLPSSSSGAGDTTLNDRLSRVEVLLEKLVEKSSGAVSDNDRDDHQVSHTPESTSRRSTPCLSNGSYVHSAPVLSLFDNELVSDFSALDNNVYV